MSIVRNNLLTRLGYTPYCGNMGAAADAGGCSNPRARFNGKQFECPKCRWQSQFEPEFIQQYKEAQARLINESAKVPEPDIQKFLMGWNKGEFPQSWRLGQAFVNHFGLSHPQCDVPNGPCLFHIRDDGKAVKAIWEHFVKVDS